MILAIKSQLSLDKGEESAPPQIESICVLFVLKKMDNDINPILLEILSHLTKAPQINFYFTDEETHVVAKNTYPTAKTLLYVSSQHENNIDYVITVGGDGTILYANKLFQKRITP